MHFGWNTFCSLLLWAICSLWIGISAARFTGERDVFCRALFVLPRVEDPVCGVRVSWPSLCSSQRHSPGQGASFIAVHSSLDLCATHPVQCSADCWLWLLYNQPRPSAALSSSCCALRQDSNGYIYLAVCMPLAGLTPAAADAAHTRSKLSSESMSVAVTVD